MNICIYQSLVNITELRSSLTISITLKTTGNNVCAGRSWLQIFGCIYFYCIFSRLVFMCYNYGLYIVTYCISIYVYYTYLYNMQNTYYMFKYIVKHIFMGTFLCIRDNITFSPKSKIIVEFKCFNIQNKLL
jgi:hypothetical protein